MRFAFFIFVAVAGLLRSQEISHSTSPVLIHRVEPEYTEEALDAKIEGEVVLSTTIGADGVPADIKVVRKLGYGLDDKAVECLKAWRFKPATSHGEPVPTRATVEMNFRLPTRKL